MAARWNTAFLQPAESSSLSHSLSLSLFLSLSVSLRLLMASTLGGFRCLCSWSSCVSSYDVAWSAKWRLSLFLRFSRHVCRRRCSSSICSLSFSSSGGEWFSPPRANCANEWGRVGHAPILAHQAAADTLCATNTARERVHDTTKHRHGVATAWRRGNQ